RKGVGFPARAVHTGGARVKPTRCTGKGLSLATPEGAVRVSVVPRPPTPGALSPSPRLLLGPGPSDVHPRVLAAMGMPVLGHLDPEFLAVMDEIQDLLRYVFQTTNRMTLAISGTGMAGMETIVVNLI